MSKHCDKHCPRPLPECSGRRALLRRFPAGAVYALRLRNGNGVTVIDAHQRVRRFAALPSSGLEDGIAFDLTGRFGHRLLVTNVAGGRTRV